MNDNKMKQLVLENPILAILRNVPTDKVLNYAGAIMEGGIRFFEVALNSKDALEQIALLKKHYGHRAHIGAELMARGYVPSIQAAFDTLLGQKHGYYKPPMPMEALEAIRFIRSIGALPVLAHPFLSLKEEDAVRRLLTQAKEAGLAGMEVRYPTYSPAVTELAEAMAREFGLLPSGGSDFHGENKPNNPMGQPPIPTEWLSALKKEL